MCGRTGGCRRGRPRPGTHGKGTCACGCLRGSRLRVRSTFGLQLRVHAPTPPQHLGRRRLLRLLHAPTGSAAHLSKRVRPCPRSTSAPRISRRRIHGRIRERRRTPYPKSATIGKPHTKTFARARGTQNERPARAHTHDAPHARDHTRPPMHVTTPHPRSSVCPGPIAFLRGN